MSEQKNYLRCNLDMEFDPVLAELDPNTERRLHRHFLFQDHGIFRRIWPNCTEIGPGVFRSSQPSPERIHALHKQGLCNIVNLRGANACNSFYYLENRACHKLGINLMSIDFFKNGMLPSATSLLKFHRFLATADGNILFHCKSGADRTGLAAALYILMFKNNNISCARGELTWHHLHFRSRKMGIFDHVIDVYSDAYRKNKIGILDWIKTDYDAVELGKSYIESSA